ncbi:HAMP domain-containing histidine kinase [Sulfitobacter albidus]|uniref:histidine kinase n=1 Tax=Sulfitobacter albidus TaxID=2829501 RepID=A0A975JE74_9RHOB|nr:HAMP domain-containing sensor histidine kinase [Sulfitobacter albidus]QUJ76813.1 HAMP domain-containing histidine kinase [Sulfitobacter albidus]
MNVRIVSAATTAAILFLTLAVAGALLVQWSVSRTQFYTERMNLAHRSYEQHLLLSSHTYQLFKQFGDALLIGDRDEGAGERALVTLINEDIDVIRGIINAEIALVGEEELEELELLDRLEDKIRKIIGEFDRDLSERDPREAWTDLTVFLDTSIDRNFRELMDEALEEELEEVAETREELARTMWTMRTVSFAFLGLALLVSALLAVGYWTLVRKRAINLMDGVERMRRGELEHPPTVKGRDELGELGSLLRKTAANLLDQRQKLLTRNTDLEAAVADRTGELQRLLDDAKTAERNRRRLLSDVSHELRTPLTIIQGESDVALRSASTDKDYRDALTRARNAATHTASLVDDLLLIARKEEGKLSFRMESTDIGQLVRDVADLFHGKITLDLSAAKTTLPADKLRIRQSLLALLNNAKQHGGDAITLRLDEYNGLRISVIDNGDGLSDIEKAQVFDRFFRGSNAAGKYDNGTGLGLPVVRAVAEGHNGSVSVDDAPGGGTIFSIVLPYEQALKDVS